MYSILIADDEKYVRQDIIRSVNWTDHGYFIVRSGTGKDKRAAA